MRKLKKFNHLSLKAFFTAAFLVLGAAAFAPSPAYAVLSESTAIESPVGRFLILETAQGLEIMSRVLGRSATSGDFEEFLLRLRESNPSAAEQLEARISRVRGDLHQAQRLRAGGTEVEETDAFTGDERVVLREVAARDLLTDLKLRTGDPQAGDIVFAEPSEAGSGFNANRERFLNPENSDTLSIKAEPGENAPKNIVERFKNKLKNWSAESDTCLKNSPDEASSAADWKYLAQQLVISESLTATASIIQTGITHIDVGSLGLDLAMTLLSQGVSSKWMKRKDSFEVLWAKNYLWGQGRARIDAEVYKISPWTDTHGASMEDAVRQHADFNYSWNAGTSWVSPLVFKVFSGVQCVLDQKAGGSAAATQLASRFNKGSFVVRTGISAGTNFLYYKRRAADASEHPLPAKGGALSVD